MKRSVFRWLRQNAEPYFGEAIVRGSEFLRKAGLPEIVVEKITDRTLALAPKVLQKLEESSGKQYYESPHLKKYNPVIIDATPQTTNPTFDAPPITRQQSYNPTFDAPPRLYLSARDEPLVDVGKQRRQMLAEKSVRKTPARLLKAEKKLKEKPAVVRKRTTRATANIQPVEKVTKKKSIQQVIV